MGLTRRPRALPGADMLAPFRRHQRINAPQGHNISAPGNARGARGDGVTRPAHIPPTPGVARG
jgi:hypothetical protein